MLCPFESETEFWSAFQLRGIVPGGARGAMAPPDFGRSVNPILTGGAQCDKEADFKSNISLHLRVSYYNNFVYSFLH